MKCLHEKISESYQTLCRIIYRRKICCLLSQKYNGKKLSKLIMKLISYREKIGENCSLIAQIDDLFFLDRNTSQITMIFNNFVMGEKSVLWRYTEFFFAERVKKLCQASIPFNHAVLSRCAYHFPYYHIY